MTVEHLIKWLSNLPEEYKDTEVCVSGANVLWEVESVIPRFSPRTEEVKQHSWETTGPKIKYLTRYVELRNY